MDSLTANQATFQFDKILQDAQTAAVQIEDGGEPVAIVCER